mgnify:CR=1 FL=1
MATELDKLVVKIEGDLSHLKKEMAKANKVVGDSSKRMSGGLKKFSDSLARVTATATKVGSVLGVVFGAVFVKSVVDVGIQIENLQIRLEALFGSAREGERAFEAMLEFAGKVPFTLGEIQQASGNLAVVAKDAEELSKVLEITGNVSAVTGLDFQQTAEQIQRSFSGGIASADVFRERGVRSLLGFSAGATVSAEETREAFERVFGKGGTFGNVTDQLAGTLTGTVSMIKDKFMQFQIAVSESFFAELKKQFGDLNKFLDDNSEKIKEIGRSVGETLAKTVSFLVDNTDGIKNFFIAFAGVAVINALARLKQSFIALNIVMLLNPITGPIMLGIASAVGISAGIIFLIEKFKDMTDITRILTDEMKDQNEVFKEGIKLREEMAKATAQKDLEDAIFAVHPTVDPERAISEDKELKAKERAKRRTEEMKELIRLNNIFAQGQGQLQVALNRTGDELTEQQKIVEGLIVVFDQASQSIAQTFADAVVKGESFRQSMLDIFQSIISKIIQLIIQIKLIEPFMGNLEDVLRGTNKHKDTKDSFAGMAGNFLGNVAQSFFGLAGLAGGGTVQPNMPYMVGEQGRELFMSNTGGRMIPNHMLGGGGSPVVIEQNLNFATGVSQTVRAEVLNLLPAIKENTLSAVREARLRGGTFAKDFGA